VSTPRYPFQQCDQRWLDAREFERAGEFHAGFQLRGVFAREKGRRGVGEEWGEFGGIEFGAEFEQRVQNGGRGDRIAERRLTASATPGSSRNCTSRKISSFSGGRVSCGSNFATRAALVFGSKASEASRRASTRKFLRIGCVPRNFRHSA
jgi:hypothetical protein